MNADLADRLDRSIGPAPDSDDELAGLLAAGHGAVRRRRGAAVAGAVAAVLVVAGGVAVATGGGADRAVAPASEPSSVAPTSAAPSPPALPPPSPDAPTAETAGTDMPGWPDGELATYDAASGQLAIHPRASVLRRIDNPYHLDPPRGSAALELSWHGTTYWYALAWDPSGTSYAAQPAPAQGSFRQWVHHASTIAATDEEGASEPVDDYPGMSTDSLVLFAADHAELLVPVNGAVILEHREGVDLGPSFAGKVDDTAAAEVRAADGKVFYVLARRTPGEAPQYIAVPRAEGGADLDAFLAFARERYAEGSGLL